MCVMRVAREREKEKERGTIPNKTATACSSFASTSASAQPTSGLIFHFGLRTEAETLEWTKWPLLNMAESSSASPNSWPP